jgi:hypothetical protein
MNPHDAWHVLFFNPFFWEQTGKRGLDLRGVCRSFRAEIPERVAIEAAFKDALIRKVEVYRLFPLSISDVVRLRSPLLFVDALRLAIRKTGSFEFCIAVVRDKGWTLCNTVGFQRNQHRAKLVAELAAGGVTWSVDGELFESAVSRRRNVESAVVWRHDSFIQELTHMDECRLLPENDMFLLHNQWEHGRILMCLRTAVGFWYKGINRDARSVCAGISRARRSHAEGRPVCRMHHQHIAAGKFIFGVVDFRPWHGSGI